MSERDKFALKIVLLTNVVLVLGATAATVAGYATGHPHVAWVWLVVLLLLQQIEV